MRVAYVTDDRQTDDRQTDDRQTDDRVQTDGRLQHCIISATVSTVG